MVVLIFIFIGLLLILLQTTVLMVNPLWPAAPDLYFILVAFLAYRLDLMRGLIILFPTSWTLDVFSGVVLGTYPAICFLAFILLKIMDTRMPVRESLYQVPLAAVGFLAVSRLVHFSLSFLEPGALVSWSWPYMLLRAGLLMVFAWPLFRLFEAILRRSQKSFVPFKLLRVRAGNRYRPDRGQE